MEIRLCPGPNHFDDLYIFKRAEGIWKMTLILDDLKQYQTQNWWRKCAVYLQKTATWQRVNVNKTFFLQSLCHSSHTSQVNSHDRMPTKIFWKWLMVNWTASVLRFELKLNSCQFDVQKNVMAELNMVTKQAFYKSYGSSSPLCLYKL